MKVLRAADLFCGAGGASTGLVRACRELGIELDLLAVNHWPVAVDTHSTNHPTVRHLCESVERVDPRVVVPGGRLHLLLAGPECTHFSTARGGRPVNPQSRASAWHILKWAQELYIDTILIENVPEFRTWGAVGADLKPLKSRKGETYRAFLDALRSLGYRVEDRILNAADYGDPTTRQRLFIMARRGRRDLRWPVQTHSRTGARTLFGSTQRWRAAREVIDWTVQGKSIFARKKPLRPATLARILAGLEKFGGPELQPFLVILRQHMGGRSVDQPVPTVAAQGQHVGLAQPFLVAMEHGGRVLDAEQPLPTITTARGGAFGVAQPVLLHTTHGARVSSVDGPLPTVTGAHRGELAVVEPFILQQQSGGAPREVSEPLPTVAAKGAIGLVEPFVISAGGPKCAARPVSDPLGTVLTRDHRAVVEPFLVPLYGEREGQDPRTHSVDEPVPTIPATGGGKFGVVEPYLAKYYGSGDSVVPTTEPIPTVTTRDRFALVEPFLVDANFGRGDARRARSVDEPVGTLPGSNRFALVQPVFNGYALDIHFRMLQPHELAAAMSFPRSYVFRGNREATVKQIGNSWPGELAKALCRTVVEDYVPARRRVPTEATA